MGAETDLDLPQSRMLAAHSHFTESGGYLNNFTVFLEHTTKNGAVVPPLKDRIL